MGRTKISHGKFSESEIIKKERAILQTLEYDVIVSSNSDFIKTFVYDFIHNNRVQIDKLEMWHHIDAFENTTIFLSKLIQHDVEFNKYKESLKSVSCIVAAFDILRSNSNNFEKESEDFMRQWILFIINESSYETNLINDVYNKIVEYYNKYDTIKFIQHNLSKSHNLTFY